ncbi:MAG: cell division protein FtsB [Pseudomonadales bacterium]|nr:septum formation initiator family protein [Gammaproteobacteria bacterium]NNL57189.1 cell division protein FtsB [Pseudomonadales bacterium]
MKTEVANQGASNSPPQSAKPLSRRGVLVVACLLLLALAWLQYRLWFADGGVRHTAQLKQQLATQQAANEALQTRSDRLLIEIASLKQGPGQIEARAREDLGLVKEGETFYRFFDATAPDEAAR